jgi:putative membrane protein
MEELRALTPGVILVSLIYSVLGMLFLMIAYKVFDLVNALDFTRELEKNNQALGTVIAGFFIAIAIIIAAAIHG